MLTKYQPGQRVSMKHMEFNLQGTIRSVVPAGASITYVIDVDGARVGHFEHGATWYESELTLLEDEACRRNEQVTDCLSKHGRRWLTRKWSNG